MSVSLRFPEGIVLVDDYNGDFLVLRSEDGGGMGRIGRALFERGFDFVDEVVATEVEVLLQVNGRYAAGRLEELTEVVVGGEMEGRTFELPVCFEEGEGWEMLEEQAGKSKGGLVEELCSQIYPIAMLGFLPGFAYLDGLPLKLQLPRKSVPSKYIAAGSLAIGGKYLGLYAIDSPGGWHVLGKTPLRLLEIPHLPPVSYAPGDRFRLPPVSYAPGDRFRLLPIDQPTFDHLLSQSLTLSDYHAGA